MSTMNDLRTKYSSLLSHVKRASIVSILEKTKPFIHDLFHRSGLSQHAKTKTCDYVRFDSCNPCACMVNVTTETETDNTTPLSTFIHWEFRNSSVGGFQDRAGDCGETLLMNKSSLCTPFCPCCFYPIEAREDHTCSFLSALPCEEVNFHEWKPLMANSAINMSVVTEPAARSQILNVISGETSSFLNPECIAEINSLTVVCDDNGVWFCPTQTRRHTISRVEFDLSCCVPGQETLCGALVVHLASAQHMLYALWNILSFLQSIFPDSGEIDLSPVLTWCQDGLQFEMDAMQKILLHLSKTFLWEVCTKYALEHEQVNFFVQELFKEFLFWDSTHNIIPLKTWMSTQTHGGDVKSLLQKMHNHRLPDAFYSLSQASSDNCMTDIFTGLKVPRDMLTEDENKKNVMAFMLNQIRYDNVITGFETFGKELRSAKQKMSNYLKKVAPLLLFERTTTRVSRSGDVFTSPCNSGGMESYVLHERVWDNLKTTFALCGSTHRTQGAVHLVHLRLCTQSSSRFFSSAMGALPHLHTVLSSSGQQSMKTELERVRKLRSNVTREREALEMECMKAAGK